MDDILVFGRDTEEHDERLRRFMETIKSSGFKLNREKCQISKSELNFFGHVIGKDGVKPNPERVKAIASLSPPNNITELRRYIGMINYLGRFVPASLSSIIKPMTDLLKNDTVWCWDKAQQEALRKVNELVTAAPHLAYYKSDAETGVFADASSYGLRAVLLQRNGKYLMPVGELLIVPAH